jgi:signal transduction histidine kinase
MSQSLAMPVETRVALELASADEVDAGMARVLGLLQRGCSAARVEWWAPDVNGTLQLRAFDGAGRGERHRFSLGPAGDVVVVGGRRDPRLASALAGVMPILRRRCVEERMAGAVTQLARRNETLEEFAALVAHELKTPLQAALLADDASSALERALDLVDSLIEAARDSRETPYASAALCLEEVLGDLGTIDAEITAEVAAILPLPEVPLRVILRNLLRNSVAAGARHVHVVAARSSGSWRLVVDDDGVGLGADASYTAGSGLGLSLCRRIAHRYGGALELAPRPAGGTRATLRAAGAP